MDKQLILSELQGLGYANVIFTMYDGSEVLWHILLTVKVYQYMILY